jgi:hypothetical protein
MKEERKTLERREQMTDLKRLRHSVSHVLACCHSEPIRLTSLAQGKLREVACRAAALCEGWRNLSIYV